MNHDLVVPILDPGNLPSPRDAPIAKFSNTTAEV